MTKLSSLLLLALAFAVQPATALTKSDADEHLRKLQSTELHEGPSLSNDVLTAKNQAREKIMASSDRQGESQLTEQASEPLEWLLDRRELKGTNGEILRRPADIDARGYQSVQLANDVWSGNHWMRFLGHTSYRYAIESFRGAKTFLQAWSHVSGPGQTYYDVAMGKSQVPIDDLSPAEKLDLLISDPQKQSRGVLSAYEWARGHAMQKSWGYVPAWVGYCHGWAPASYHVERPIRSVEVMDATGTKKIRFYPNDIKALTTALWANALPQTRLVGNKCNEANPKVDPTSGRILNSNCFNVNPGTFHIALANQLGSARRNLNLDSFYDAEVWNFPIVSYSYRYFNPQTLQTVDKLEQGMIPIESFTNDKFKRWRSKKTRQVVGVVTEVIYRVGVIAYKIPQDMPQHDVSFKNIYAYDLELNEKGEAIGGEWYQMHHPDFIWVTPPEAKAVSPFDAKAIGDWDPARPLPESWKSAAISSAQRGLPLSKIVNRLVALSRAEPTQDVPPTPPPQQPAPQPAPETRPD